MKNINKDFDGNLLVFGKVGVGKTTGVKNILMNLVKENHVVCVIDPHSEYIKFTNYLGGIVLNSPQETDRRYYVNACI